MEGYIGKISLKDEALVSGVAECEQALCKVLRAQEMSQAKCSPSPTMVTVWHVGSPV